MGPRLPLLFILFLAILTACNESLPVREDIANMVTIELSSQYYVVPNSDVSGAAGQLQFFVTIKNNTDDVLEDVARLEGTMEITWIPRKGEEKNFTMQRTVPLTRSNIFRAKSYDPVTRRLAIAPLDSVVLNYVWNLKTDDSTYILMYLQAHNDPTCMVNRVGGFPWNRRLTNRQTFTVAASIKIFDRLAVMTARELTVSYCIKGADLGEANGQLGLPPCADLSKVSPCSLIGE
ncbi:MAG: hypothetical protein KA247_01975 [Bacteroidetes bacterium]|nr:hypothetical protein [Bacteroidota bacterium]